MSAASKQCSRMNTLAVPHAVPDAKCQPSPNNAQNFIFASNVLTVHIQIICSTAHQNHVFLRDNHTPFCS